MLVQSLTYREIPGVHTFPLNQSGPKNPYTAYCIWSVISSFSNLNRRSSSLGLFCHVPLKRDQGDWGQRLWLRDTPNAIGCIFILVLLYSKSEFIEGFLGPLWWRGNVCTPHISPYVNDCTNIVVGYYGVAMISRLLQTVGSLLQNTVSFIGLFCGKWPATQDILWVFVTLHYIKLWGGYDCWAP